MLYEEVTRKIIGAIFRVHKNLGPGLVEMPYHNALFYDLKAGGFAVQYNAPYVVRYQGQVVGEYFADLVVDRKIIMEVKSVKQLSKQAEAQILN